MKVATSQEMRDIDKYAIEKLGIPGVVLMENAGLKVFAYVKKMLGKVENKTIKIFCGKGNNGGDGYVAARHLLNHGANVEVYLLGEKKSVSGDAEINLNILLNMGIGVKEILTENDVIEINNDIKQCDLIIDAIFGTGIRGEIQGPARSLINNINHSGKPVLSIDIPSGIQGDTGKICGVCVKASATVSFALPKLGLLLYPGAEFVGKLIIADIGIPQKAVDSVVITSEVITEKNVKPLFPKRSPDTHKGNYGRVLILAGSAGFTGAAALTAMGALRSGAGLVTLGIPESLNPIMEVKLTEAMTMPLPETPVHTLSLNALPVIIERINEFDAIAVGPGLSNNKEIYTIVKGVIKNCKKPIVIDADGLNVLAGAAEVLKNAKSPIIITPHPGEMARLMNTTTSEIQGNRIEIAKKAASELKSIVILKGARSLIAHPDGRLAVNLTGNPGMATGGSGDVLTGILAGLLAQGLSPYDAAVAGVYLHGLAGDFAAKKHSQRGLVAGDILSELPGVLKVLEK